MTPAATPLPRSSRIPQLLLATLALVGLSFPASAPASAPRSQPGLAMASRHHDLHGNAGRAEYAYRAMQHWFYLPARRLYRGNPFSYLWPFSQALTATISMSRVPGAARSYRRDVGQRLAGLQSYWNAASQPPGYDGGVGPPLGRGGYLYYDDNAWVGLEYVRLFETDHVAWHLHRAQQLFHLMTAAWDTNRGDACPGGVPFSNAPHNDQRNAITAAPGAQLGVGLYRATHDPAALQWALRMYRWVRQCLTLPDGLYADHIEPGGAVDRTTWSYNQGSMLGAAAMLFEATRQSAYLDQARQIAARALAHFDPGRLHSEMPFFVSVYLRNLLALDGIRPDPRYRRAAQQYVDWAWRRVRQPASGLFAFGPHDSVQLLDQAAIVNVYSYLASPPRNTF